MFQITTVVSDYIKYNTFNVSNDKIISIIKEKYLNFTIIYKNVKIKLNNLILRLIFH